MKERNTQMDIPKLTASLEKLAAVLERKNSIDEKKLMLEHKKFLFEQHKFKQDGGKPVNEVIPDAIDNLKIEDFRNTSIEEK